MSIINTFSACKADKALSYSEIMADPNRNYWQWFNDEACFEKPFAGFGHGLTFVCSFLTFDFICVKFLYNERNKLLEQYLMHHIMSVVGFGSSFFAGFAQPGICNTVLLCETSSIFLNYKDMFDKKSKDAPLAQLNQLCFFITYTIFRMATWPMMIYLTYKDTFLHWDDRMFYQKVFAVSACIQCVCVYGLNCYWYMLVLKGLKKLMQTAGVTAKTNSKEFEALDDYDTQITSDRKSVV